MEQKEQAKRKRRLGDRSDGRLVRTLPPMAHVSPYIMPTRAAASNYFKDAIEITEIEKYIRKKRKEGLTGFGIMHVIIAAYVRAVSQRPAINRFLSGQHVYARDEHIEVSLVVKKEMTNEAPDTCVKAFLSAQDTANEVYEKMNALVSANKGAQDLDSGFDDLAKFISSIPGVFLKFVVWLLNLLDYFGLLPRKLTKLSPFHASFFITSMGSLGIPPIYHHLYNFGNIPIFVAFGAKRKQYELRKDGSVAERKYVDYTVVTDERICDGFYYASAFKLMRSYFKNPYILDEPVESIVPDID